MIFAKLWIKNYFSISGFLVMKTKKNIQFIYQRNFHNHLDLFLISGEGKKHYIVIKDLDRFIYDHTLLRERKHFWRYCLQAFSTAEILKSRVNDCFKINGKQMIKLPKIGEYIRFEHYHRKTKALFMTYTDFESILVSEGNKQQNADELYTNKYQKHVLCSYCYKCVC